MSCVLQPLSVLVSFSVPLQLSSWYNVTLLTISHTIWMSRTHLRIPAPSKGNGTHRPIQHSHTFTHKAYATVPATGMEALSLSRPVTSIISSWVLLTSSIDERRYQPARKSGYTFLRKKEAIFGDVLCSLLECPPACFVRWERKSKTCL